MARQMEPLSTDMSSSLEPNPPYLIVFNGRGMEAFKRRHHARYAVVMLSQHVHINLSSTWSD